MEAFDVIAAVRQADPYPYYATLARQEQLVYDAHLRLWIAAHPALVMEVMGNRHCRVRPLAEPVPAVLGAGSAGQVFGALVRMNEGEAHSAPKVALQRALGAMAQERVRERCTHIASALLPAVPDAAALSAWTYEVPVRTVASLLGFADAQLPAVARWMGEFVVCLSPLSNPSQIGQAHAASLHLLASMRELLQAPQAGTLLESVAQEAAQAGWRHDHAILANLVGLLSQTYEATAGLIGNTIVAMQDGAQGTAAQLVADVARRDPPVQNTRRFVAEATRIGEVALAAGDVILLALAAASRDPQSGGRVFGFGHGLHVCPGQAMAETMAAAAIDCLPTLPRMGWRYRASVNARLPEFFDIKEQA